MVQIILALISLAVIGGVVFFLYHKRKNERPDLKYVEKVSIDSLGELIAKELAEAVRDDDLDKTNDMMYQSVSHMKRELADAVNECRNGVVKARNMVLAFIRSVLEREFENEQDCCDVVNFAHIENEQLTIKWEVLIYYVKRRHKNDCMKYIQDKYDIVRERRWVENLTGEIQMRRIFDASLLDQIFAEEVPKTIDYSDMLDMLAILIYNKRYGYGIVTTLRMLDIDGFNFGTSGSVRYLIDGNYNIPYRTTNSVWVQLNSKWVHFSFLDFESVNEMKRVVNQMVSWGTTAPMTEKIPYKVNDAYDGARITTVRPPAGEAWACFVRKFSAGLYVKEKLLNKKGIHNWELPATLIYYLMRGEQTCAFTGQQNTGKTSMMKAAMADVAMVNIRILEMSFELAIRELYPWKNVLTVKSTDYVSAAELQDLLKKTDGYLSMVGEVAQDIVAARMIQFCLIASAFTMFSHHAKNDDDLVNGLANSLVACGEYENHDVATSTVLDAIKNNIHLDFVKDERVISYISEIVKLSEIAPYPDLTKSNSVEEAIDQLTSIQKEYYTRVTDRRRFESRKIIRFNPETMTYEAYQGYSPEALDRIINKLQGEDRRSFITWYRTNWAHTLK